jgi:hypothetical protein
VFAVAEKDASRDAAALICCHPNSVRIGFILPRRISPPSGSPWRKRSTMSERDWDKGIPGGDYSM